MARLLQERQESANAYDQSQAESRELQERLDELRDSFEPFSQVVVIGVDVSGSTNPVLHEIKQAYRDVLHVVKSKNSYARVTVVIHGSSELCDPSPVQVINSATFRIVDTIVNARGGIEDYSYCLKEANEIFKMHVGSKRLVILIGDGNDVCFNTDTHSTACEQLKSANILAHSIIIPFNLCPNSSDHSTLQDIAQVTGGRIEYKDTYLSALDEILQYEREQHFRAL